VRFLETRSSGLNDVPKLISNYMNLGRCENYLCSMLVLVELGNLQPCSWAHILFGGIASLRRSDLGHILAGRQGQTSSWQLR
jgi:hypothetical protein